MSKFSYLLCILLLPYLFSSGFRVSANEPDLTIYGNEPQFANNIILTIDDASIEPNTRAMFELLRDQGMTATFFPNTRYIKRQDPQLWRDIVAAGFEIGYHTRNHNSYLTPDELNADFNQFQDEIRTILNNPSYNIRYVRPPNGVWNADWMSWANANHLYTVRWNVTSVAEDLNYIEGVFGNRNHGGSILLLHTGDNDVHWLRNNLPVLRGFRYNQQDVYTITSLSRGFNDG